MIPKKNLINGEIFHIQGKEDSVYQDVSSCQFYRFNAVPIKIPAGYLVEIKKLILKFIWRNRRPRIANSILKENKVREAKSGTKGIIGPSIWLL